MHSVVLISFWVVVYLVQFSHISTHLEREIDGMHAAMPLMPIASCTVDYYIAAEMKGDAAAIAVSVYVQRDKPSVDIAATMHQFG